MDLITLNPNREAMEKQIKAAGYVRVSTAIQAEEGESLATQRQQIEDFIKQKNWQLTNIYADEGATGTKVEYRPYFQRMITDAKEKKFDVIVFTKFSRFARNARDYQNYSFELKKYDVNLACVKENIDPTTHTGKMIAGILALFAEWEHETIREQMYENKMIKWRDHRTFLGKPPFGYSWNKEKKRLEVVPNERDIYLEVVKMYCEKRMAMRDIAIELNSRGLKCKRKVWNSATISYMLKNPCYYGNYVVNTVKYIDGKKGAGTKRTKNRKPESEIISFPVDPFLTKTEWDKIQSATQLNKIIPKRIGEHTISFFLRSVLVCDRCGSKMNARMGSYKKNGTFLRYYVCYYAGTSKKSIESGKQKCNLPYIKAEVIEKAVWANIMALFLMDDPEKIFGHLFDKEKNEKNAIGLKETILRCESELLSKNRERERLFKGLSREDTDTDELWKKLRKNMDEILTIEGQIKENTDKLTQIEEKHKTAQEIYEFYKNNERGFESLYKQINDFDSFDRKILVEAMLERPIRVGYKERDSNYIELPSYPTTDIKLKFNPEILMRFANEGKIQLNKNSFDYNASSYT
jgi:site-specific DNA recombinase